MEPASGRDYQPVERLAEQLPGRIDGFCLTRGRIDVLYGALDEPYANGLEEKGGTRASAPATARAGVGKAVWSTGSER